MGLDFIDKINEAASTINSPEQMLGAGLLQPFSGANSGARKIMYSVHNQHKFAILNPEMPIIATGYENRYGDLSSSVTKADSDYEVVAKISKFSFSPNHHYWLILRDLKNKKLDIVERISYEFVTESYGFLYNNEYMDTLKIHDKIPNKTVIKKSTGFDRYNNKIDGINFNVCYMNLDRNMEDSIVFSDKAASKLTSPLIKPVEIMMNDNDIPLNLYGDDNKYKIFPDIGEKVKDANLLAMRKEKKEEAFFNQSVDRLKKIVMSDEIKQAPGTVIDVDIYCNNPDILDGYYYGQLKMYYNELQRSAAETAQIMLPYVADGYELSYELQKFYANAKRVCNKDQYTSKRTFSNIILKITVLEERLMEPGDKASNRYGGKGVTSDIMPECMMPRFKNYKGEYEYVDVIFNTSTMYGRENIGQIFELSLTHIGNEIIYRILHSQCSLQEAYQMIHTYISLCSPEQGEYFKQTCSNMSTEELSFFIQSIIDSGAIYLSMKPISDNMSIDKLNDIYKAFPWVKKTDAEVMLVGSNGIPRYVKCRKPILIGKQYIFRLKQFAEEKFSVTSLSSTNIKNENTKSKNKKEFKEIYSNTPIRFGNMETANFCHIGIEDVISNLMIHSVSPQGRRLVEQMYTEDPFSIDIKLDGDSTNRSAEIANTYLKTIGRRLVFKKSPKKINKFSMSPISFQKDPYINPLIFIPKDIQNDENKIKEYLKSRKEMEELKKKNKAESPIIFSGGKRGAD